MKANACLENFIRKSIKSNKYGFYNDSRHILERYFHFFVVMVADKILILLCLRAYSYIGLYLLRYILDIVYIYTD